MMRTSQLHHSSFPTRRDVLAVALGGAFCGLGTTLVRGDDKPQPAKLKGRIKQAIIYHMQVQEATPPVGRLR
jgi:hypothetical protein